MEFDTVISAVGITGNTEGLGLEDLGVELDRGLRGHRCVLQDRHRGSSRDR